MIRYMFILLMYILPLAVMCAGVPFCTIRNYDERDGLSQRLVKQVVQDDNGYLWVATWNGLNRFDGYEFTCIRPPIDDETRRYSSRISDIKLGLNGMLWCRIDHKVLRFDVNTYSFLDSQARLEEKFGRVLPVDNMMVTTDDEVVLGLADGTYIIMSDDTMPEQTAVLTDNIKGKRHRSTGNRKLGHVKGYDRDELVILRRDDAGTVWLVTRDGELMCAPGTDGPFTTMGHIDAVGMKLRYATTDTQGNIWLCSSAGLHRLTLGTAPFTLMTHEPESMLRTSMRDSNGRIWMSWSDAECLTVSGPDLSSTLHIAPDGSLSHEPVAFGAPVYSITEVRPGEIWLGTKPDGLYRLTARTDGKGYAVRHYVNDPSQPGAPSGRAYYDGAVDSHGRLWLASMGTGIDVVAAPSDENPCFLNIASTSGYPQEAMSVRRIVMINDSMAVAATTGGLLAFNIPSSLEKDTVRFVLHVSEPGRAHSLGNIATMDAAIGLDGNLYVATESDGVAALITPLRKGIADSWDFRSYRSQGGVNPDVALSVQPSGSDSLLLITSGNEVYMLDPETGDTKVYGASFWHRNQHFSDAVPLHLEDGGWLVGLCDGAARVRFDSSFAPADSLPLIFNAVSIAGRPDSLLSPRSGRVVLRPSERDVTLRFSALCYADAASVCYAFRVDDDEWTPLGTSRTVTFANLEPGTYNVTVRSTDTHGQWIGNERTITVEVLPTFWETRWAKVLYVILTFAIVGGAVWITLYIRRIKRQQREMLDAHLRLLDARATHGASAVTADPAPMLTTVADTPPSSPQLSEDDRQLMDAVMDYIEKHLSDSSITVDDMALGVAVSRSGLTRKMKSLMGVTPAEFLRETRLTLASTLLATTAKPIKEIAADCGFSDMNYFGKCFKSSRGITPGAYRKAHGGV